MTHPRGPRLLRTLAERLAHDGIATLRCDDRGIGGSTGSYFDSSVSDLAADALAGVAFLRKPAGIDPEKVGVIGISEGAVVGAIAASRSDDVRFVVMLAGVGVAAKKVLRQRTLEHARESSYPPERIAQQLATLDSLFTIVEKARVPVLAATGDLDRSSSADQNFPAMLTALGKGRNPDYTLTRVPGLSHIFQEAQVGGPREYLTLAEDFSPMGAEIVSAWIRVRFGR